MRYLLAVLMAALVAVPVAAALEPADARADSGGYVRACNGERVYLRPAEKETLRLHNNARASRDLPRLCIQQQLQKAARAHSADMIRNDYFSHTSRDGTTFSQRIKRTGYTSGASSYRLGENIAGGSGSYATPQSRHRAWMNSSGHRQNILNAGFRQVGIGVASGTYKSYDGYKMYTVDFGYRR